MVDNKYWELAELSGDMARCGRCGFCQEVCPVYQVSGDECGVARGRNMYAKELVEQFGMKVPVLVDDIDETVVHAYGRMPNMVYIIDREGKIAYKADWTEQPRIDLLLDEMLAEQGVAAT